MTALAPDRYALVADIGGTNTRVALADGERLLTETIRRYRNADFPGLETLLRSYVAEEGGVDCAGACAAVAGPVHDGTGTLTNLDWTLDRETLARATGAERTALLNDLQAQGWALGRIADDNILPVVAGPEAPLGRDALVIGVGTGFNAAAVHETPAGRHVPASEAGHANLPIRSEEELRLCRFVETAHGFPAIEDVLSGRGLERVYAWLAAEDGTPREAHGAEIVAAGEAGEPLAERALAVFVALLGRVAGNLALIHLPFGGIYLAGGVSRAITPALARHGFAEAFRDKGRFAGFMGNFAVSVIEDDFAALAGAAAYLATQAGGASEFAGG